MIATTELDAIYPAVRARLGRDAFDRLVSRADDRSDLAETLPEQIENDPALRHAPWLAEAARLERAMHEVVEAATEGALTRDDLECVPRDAWGSVRLAPVEALRLMRLEFAVNDAVNALRQGRALASPRHRTQWLAVFRSKRDGAVRRLAISRDGYHLLVALVSGTTLGAALAEASFAADPDAPQRLFLWLREWVSEGLFAAVELVDARDGTPTLRRHRA